MNFVCQCRNAIRLENLVSHLTSRYVYSSNTMSMFIERGKHQNNHNGSQNIAINSIEYVEVAGFEVIAGKAGTG